MDYSAVLFLIGRILYGGYFVMSGVNHLTKTGMLAGYAQSKGVPSPKFAVVVSGLLLIAGGLGVLLGVYVSWAVLALVVFLVPVSFTMHAHWKVSDPAMKMADMQHFLKNMALLGGALMLLAISTPWPLGM
jgi:putative oxidoreductase